MTRSVLIKKKVRKVLTEGKLDDFGPWMETYPRSPSSRLAVQYWLSKSSARMATDLKPRLYRDTTPLI